MIIRVLHAYTTRSNEVQSTESTLAHESPEDGGNTSPKLWHLPMDLHGAKREYNNRLLSGFLDALSVIHCVNSPQYMLAF
jgi:hypothetical protein